MAGQTTCLDPALDLGHASARMRPARAEVRAYRAVGRDRCAGARRHPARRIGVCGRPPCRGAGAQARRAVRLDPAGGGGDGDRGGADRVDHADRRRGQRDGGARHGFRRRDDRAQRRRRALPRAGRATAFRADVPAAGRIVGIGGAGHAGGAGADPAQLHAGGGRPLLFRHAGAVHRRRVAGAVGRVRLRADREAPRLFSRRAVRGAGASRHVRGRA